MPTYHYMAVDAAGRPVEGDLEAASPEALQSQLAARNLRLTGYGMVLPPEPPAEPWRDRGWKAPPAVFGQGRLSAEETAELTSKMADLVKAGLPLAPGLRAMADEMPRGLWRGPRLAAMLRAIAAQLDAGASLEDALAFQQGLFPRHFCALILAGIRGGRLAESLEELVSIQRETMELRRRVKLTMAYPALLLSFSVLLFLGFATLIVPQFARLFADFGADLPVATQLVVGLAKPGLGGYLAGLAVVMLGIGLLAVFRGQAAVQWMLYRIPVLGAIWRWNGLVEFARLMALLLDQQMALPDALRLTAEGIASVELKLACRRAAERVEGGQSPVESFGGERAVPPSLRPLLAWGQRLPALAQAFHAAADMFEARTQVYVTLLEPVMPPVIFIVLGIMVGGFIVALLMPLVSLIQKLT
jgi:type II secretory pathway component PulF